MNNTGTFEIPSLSSAFPPPPFDEAFVEEQGERAKIPREHFPALATAMRAAYIAYMARDAAVQLRCGELDQIPNLRLFVRKFTAASRQWDRTKPEAKTVLCNFDGNPEFDVSVVDHQIGYLNQLLVDFEEYHKQEEGSPPRYEACEDAIIVFHNFWVDTLKKAFSHKRDSPAVRFMVAYFHRLGCSIKPSACGRLMRKVRYPKRKVNRGRKLEKQS